MKIIEDKLMDPYIIEVEKRNYTVFVWLFNKDGERYKDTKGTYQRTFEGHYTSLAGAINMVVRLKKYRTGKKKQTLKEYVSTYVESIESIRKSLQDVDRGRVQ